MKKLFAILAIATVFVACNSGAETAAAAADTAAAAVTSAVDTAAAKIDTAAAKLAETVKAVVADTAAKK